MRKMLILVPSRNRPQNIQALMQSLKETNTKSDFMAIVDDDDPKLDDYLDLGCDVFMVKREGKGMARPLNFVARHFKNDYQNFCFLGDDHRPRTQDWDEIFIQTLNELKTGLVYGNDLLQGERLPTAIAMTGSIVRELDGMVPPNMIHLYLDNFWLQLGKDLKSIKYLGDVIIEHVHPIAGKSNWDETYKEVNAQDVYSADELAFEKYMKSDDYQNLLKALK